MANLTDFDYFSTRAWAAHAAAQRANTDKARDIHLEMAERYRALANDSGRASGGQSAGLINAAESAVEIVLIEPRNLNEFYRIENGRTIPLQR